MFLISIWSNLSQIWLPGIKKGKINGESEKRKDSLKLMHSVKKEVRKKERKRQRIKLEKEPRKKGMRKRMPVMTKRQEKRRKHQVEVEGQEETEREAKKAEMTQLKVRKKPLFMSQWMVTQTTISNRFRSKKR